MFLGKGFLWGMKMIVKQNRSYIFKELVPYLKTVAIVEIIQPLCLPIKALEDDA